MLTPPTSSTNMRTNDSTSRCHQLRAPSVSLSPARRRNHAVMAGSTVGYSASKRRNSRRTAHTMKQL
eukprot:720668-Prymnesium_polylepis.1